VIDSGGSERRARSAVGRLLDSFAGKRDDDAVAFVVRRADELAVVMRTQPPPMIVPSSNTPSARLGFDDLA
jgi:hypothetical protein